MAGTLATPLREQPDIIKLLDFFKTPGHESEHQEYAALLDYVETVENRYTSILDELTALREQISGIADKKNPTAVMVERLSSVVSGIGERLKALKDSIVEYAQNTFNAAKDKSLSAVGAVSGFLHIRDGLQAVSNGLGKAAVAMGTLEQFHQEIAAARKESEPIPPANAESVSLAELLTDVRVDFENLSTEELKTTYEKLLAIGMDNDLTANELACLQYLAEDAESLLPERGDYEQTAVIEADQGAEM